MGIRCPVVRNIRQETFGLRCRPTIRLSRAAGRAFMKRHGLVKE